MKNRIREVRKEQGMTLDELASSSGVSRSTISRYENEKDKISPSVPAMNKIADVLGVSVPYLQGLTDDPTRPGEATSYEKAIIKFLWCLYMNWSRYMSEGSILFLNNHPVQRFADALNIDISDASALRDRLDEEESQFDPVDNDVNEFQPHYEIFFNAFFPFVDGLKATLKTARFTETDISNAIFEDANSAVYKTVVDYLNKTASEADIRRYRKKYPERAKLSDDLTKAYMNFNVVYSGIIDSKTPPKSLLPSRLDSSKMELQSIDKTYREVLTELQSAIQAVDSAVLGKLKLWNKK